MRQAVALNKAYRLLNHGPVTLISSAHAGARNVMAAAWTMPLDFEPPKVCVVIDKSTYSRGLIEASGEFVINIPCQNIARETLAAGSCSGREGDKFAACGLQALAADVVGAPLVDGCVAYLECRIIEEARNQQHYDLFIGEVVAASADSRVFQDGHWHFPDPALRTLHYVAGGNFLVTGAAIEVSAAQGT